MNRDTKGFRRVIWYILAAVAVILLVGGYAFSSYYKLEHIEVMGTSRYSEEEVKRMVLHGIAAQNTVLASRFLSRTQITDIPFVDSITVTALGRDTVAISVHEKKAVGCFPYLDSYVYFDRNGVFIEGERIRDESVPYFSGIRVDNIVQNHKLDLKKSAILNTAVILSTIFQKNTLLPDDIQFDENNQITLLYGDIVVALGQDTNLEDKMTRVLAILPKVQNRKGTLHAETVNQNSKIITFELDITEETWDGGYESDGTYTGEGEYNKDGQYAGPKPSSGTEKGSGDGENRDGTEAAANQWGIDSSYLDEDGDGINDFTGDPISEDSAGDVSYLDEDGDGINDYTGEPMPGTEAAEDSRQEEDSSEEDYWEEESSEEDYWEEDSWTDGEW